MSVEHSLSPPRTLLTLSLILDLILPPYRDYYYYFMAGCLEYKMGVVEGWWGVGEGLW